MAHSFVMIYLHIIFSTKNRDSLIPLSMENRLHSYVAGIAKARKAPILKINGTDDHIHMLLKLHPEVSCSTLVKEMKSYSTGWLKKEGYVNFGWQEGYGAFSSSAQHINPIIHYIENQKEHHQRHTFQQEVESLKKEWGNFWVFEQ